MGFTENVAGGQATPAQVVKEWMESDGHRANILRADVSYIGVGYYYDANSVTADTDFLTNKNWFSLDIP